MKELARDNMPFMGLDIHGLKEVELGQVNKTKKPKNNYQMYRQHAFLFVFVFKKIYCSFINAYATSLQEEHMK
jgi:hypothetical protein